MAYGLTRAPKSKPRKTDRQSGPRIDPAISRTPYICDRVYDEYVELFTRMGAGPRVILGWYPLLRYLNDTLGIRTYRGERITRRVVERWIADRGFPFLRGIYTPRKIFRCVTLERYVDAWILSRPRNGVKELFMFRQHPRFQRPNLPLSRSEYCPATFPTRVRPLAASALPAQPD